MEIESTTFGTITMDGKTYEHDVIVRLSGEVVKRKKKNCRRSITAPPGCEQLIVGSGQIRNVRLSPEAETYFAKKNCKVLLQPTPEAIHVFNRSTAKKIGLFHVTC